METTMQRVGKWSWIIGICLAIVLGVITDAAKSPVVTAVLVILGIIVGILNVTTVESKDFLIAAVALIIAANFGSQVFNLPIFNGSLDMILVALQYFVVPMTIIVAVKSIYAVAKDE